jgi:hypothetical protein
MNAKRFALMLTWALLELGLISTWLVVGPSTVLYAVEPAKVISATDATHVDNDSDPVDANNESQIVASMASEPVGAVAISGTRAYASIGNGLVVLDISDYLAPEPMGAVVLDADGIGDIQAQGDHLYVAGNKKGLRIVSVETPTHPVEVGFTLDITPVSHLAVVDNAAYVAGGNLGVVSIENPADPILQGVYEVPWGSSTGVDARGEYAYLTRSELSVISVTNPTSPTLVGTVSLFMPEDVDLLGDYAYVADHVTGLRIISVTAPTNPSLTGAVVPPNSYTNRVVVSGTHAYVCGPHFSYDGTGYLHVISVAVPTTPSVLGSLFFPGGCNNLDITGEYVYLANRDGLRIVSVSNPASPTEVASFTLTRPEAGFLHSSPSWPGQPTVFTNTTLVTGAASYVWSYGDGVTSTIESPSHTHTFAAPGVYTVVLTATSLVVDDVVSDTVTVSSPPAGVTVCPAGPPVCGYPTIQEGVDAATEGDVIKVATGVYTDVNGRPAPTGYGFPPPGGVVTQVVYITKTVTIRGGYTAPDFADPPDPDANPTMLDAEGRGRVILIAGSISPVIEGLQITGGDAAGLQGPTSGDLGGGLCIISAAALITNNQVFSNTSGPPGQYGEGGGIALFNSAAMIAENKIVSNTADMFGGGLWMSSSTATVRNNTIAMNRARLTGWSGGGGVYVQSSPAVIENNVIQRNVSSGTGEGNGGGILVQGNGPTLVDENVFENNIAGTADDSAGGGGCLFASDAIFSDNVFRGNVASTAGTGFGGGMYTSSSAAFIHGNTFVSNTASIAAAGSGGALMLSENSPAEVTNNVIFDNVGSTVSTGYGGGIRVWGSSALLQDNTVYSNVASKVPSGYGGGISLSSGSPVLKRNHIAGNRASAGGGIHLSGSEPTMTDNLVRGNTSSAQGAGIYINGGSPVLANTVVVDNILDEPTGIGAGIYVLISSPRLVHSTIGRNLGGDGSGVHVTGLELVETYYSSTVWLTNTILVSHTVGITVTSGDTANLDSTLWHANGIDHNGAGTIHHLNNYEGYPAFGADGYHLTGMSAAINAGIDAGVNTDIDGDSRPQGLRLDLGADEWLCAVALAAIGITGPIAGYTDTAYSFHAIITPAVGTEPIRYTWWPEPVGGQGTATAEYQWTTPGVFSVTVDAQNCGGTCSDLAYMLVISDGNVATVGPETGGTVVYTDAQDNSVVIQVPAGAVTESISLVYTPVDTATVPPGFAFADHVFDLEVYRDGHYLPDFVFQQPPVITLHYSSADVVGIDEATLVLDYWNGSAWMDAASTCVPPSEYDRHPEADWLAVPICHLCRFALFGQPEAVKYRIYLPLAVRED